MSIVKLAAGPEIKESHKGRLHRALGIPEDQPIPIERLESGKNSSDPHMRSMCNYALMAKTRWHHS